jgi:hypothetical protein
MIKNNEIKQNVLNIISKGSNYVSIGRSKYRINSNIVHVRYCSTSSSNKSLYKFNINPNTLNANYELWICGNLNYFYLIPTEIMTMICEDPNTYPDNHYPDIRVVSVDISKDKIIYGTGGKSLNISKYFKKVL